MGRGRHTTLLRIFFCFMQGNVNDHTAAAVHIFPFLKQFMVVFVETVSRLQVLGLVVSHGCSSLTSEDRRF